MLVFLLSLFIFFILDLSLNVSCNQCNFYFDFFFFVIIVIRSAKKCLIRYAFIKIWESTMIIA